jgi:hypothetical protein
MDVLWIGTGVGVVGRRLKVRLMRLMMGRPVAVGIGIGIGEVGLLGGIVGMAEVLGAISKLSIRISHLEIKLN